MTSWTEMRRSDFDAAAPLTLFDLEAIPASPRVLAQPDKQGSASLFTDTAGEE